MADASSDVVLNDVQPSSSISPNVPVEELNGLPPSSPPPTTASSVGSVGGGAAAGTTTTTQSATTGTGNTVTAPTAVASSISTSTTTTTGLKPSSSKASSKPKSTKPKPRPSINANTANNMTTSTTLKSSSTPSPSPPPPTLPPPPPPRQTIRLQIQLGGPEKYEVDIAALAKETGQRPPTPVLVKRDTSESEGESEGDNNVNGKGGEGKGDGKETRKRKKRSQASEYYDVNDPFIDDSELAIDERTYFAQTKQQGFYVSSGEVALLKDKSSPKKPKPKKHQPEASSSSSHTHLAPSSSITGKSKDLLLTAGSMPLSDIDEGDASSSSRVLPPYGSLGLLGHVLAKDRKRYTTVVENGKKKKVVDVASFHPELREAIGALKGAIEQESWEQKGKFPPNIKPLLNSVAIQAIKLDEYDDHFFNLMPTLFPYNKFTMTKLIKRTVFPDHCQILTDRQDELLEELTALANAGFTKAEEEYEKHLSQWAQRQEQHRVEAELNGRSESMGVGGEDPSRHGTEDEGGGGSGGGAKEKDGMDVDRVPPTHSDDTPTAPSTATTTAHPKENPPTKRYRLTDAMKLVIWQLVSISNELCRLENEKNQYENSMATKSDQALRKSLYQKIVAAFPPGWMSSGQISREVSVMKKRLERETAENES